MRGEVRQHGLWCMQVKVMRKRRREVAVAVAVEIENTLACRFLDEMSNLI